MREARKRNPSIRTYGLPWGFPLWADNYTHNDTHCIAQSDTAPPGACGFNEATIQYFVAFLKCVQSATGAPLDFLGLYNEVGGIPSAAWVLALRAAMERAGAVATNGKHRPIHMVTLGNAHLRFNAI